MTTVRVALIQVLISLVYKQLAPNTSETELCPNSFIRGLLISLTSYDMSKCDILPGSFVNIIDNNDDVFVDLPLHTFAQTCHDLRTAKQWWHTGRANEDVCSF